MRSIVSPPGEVAKMMDSPTGKSKDKTTSEDLRSRRGHIAHDLAGPPSSPELALGSWPLTISLMTCAELRTAHILLNHHVAEGLGQVSCCRWNLHVALSLALGSAGELACRIRR